MGHFDVILFWNLWVWGTGNGFGMVWSTTNLQQPSLSREVHERLTNKYCWVVSLISFLNIPYNGSVITIDFFCQFFEGKTWETRLSLQTWYYCITQTKFTKSTISWRIVATAKLRNNSRKTHALFGRKLLLLHLCSLIIMIKNMYYDQSLWWMNIIRYQ